MSDIYSKAKVMVFLGAGASAALDMPTSQKFPEFMQEKHNWDLTNLSKMYAGYLKSTGKGEYSPEQIDAEDLRDCLLVMENTSELLKGLKASSIPPHPGIGKEKHGRDGSYANKNTKRAQEHPDSYQY